MDGTFKYSFPIKERIKCGKVVANNWTLTFLMDNSVGLRSHTSPRTGFRRDRRRKKEVRGGKEGFYARMWNVCLLRFSTSSDKLFINFHSKIFYLGKLVLQVLDPHLLLGAGLRGKTETSCSKENPFLSFIRATVVQMGKVWTQNTEVSFTTVTQTFYLTFSNLVTISSTSALPCSLACGDMRRSWLQLTQHLKHN